MLFIIVSILSSSTLWNTQNTGSYFTVIDSVYNKHSQRQYRYVYAQCYYCRHTVHSYMYRLALHGHICLVDRLMWNATDCFHFSAAVGNLLAQWNNLFRKQMGSLSSAYRDNLYAVNWLFRNSRYNVTPNTNVYTLYFTFLSLPSITPFYCVSQAYTIHGSQHGNPSPLTAVCRELAECSNV